MRKYLYEAKTASGTQKSGYVDAISVADARVRLKTQGLSSVVVIDDDLTASLRETSERAGVAADSDVDMLVRYKPSAWRFAWLGFRRNWILHAAFAGAVFYLATAGMIASALAVAVVALAIALFPGWITWQQNELYRQFWAGHWDASERIARRLRKMWFVQSAPTVLLELDSRIASALMKKGDVVGAMRAMAPWEASDKVPAHAVVVKVGGLYFLGRDWKAWLAAQERGFEMSAGSDTSKIDVAQVLARVGDDDARATALLDDVETAGLAPLAIAFLEWGRGVIALNGGQNDEALGHLAVSVGEMQKMGENPLLWGALATATGYLALAMARTGRREAARAMLADVKSIVEWHAEDRLLDGLRAEGML